jgi:hypothetical protein
MKKFLTVALATSIAALSISAADAASRRTSAKPTSPGINNLKGHTKKQKGVIYVNGKRLTICADWGKDKGWCKEHNK